MKKELPSKFRFEANGFYYLAELSSQADTYALSQTDEHGKDIRNLNHQALKESVQRCVEQGHWEVIEEPFELPSKFSFKHTSTLYTAIKQDDNTYEIYWKYNDGVCSSISYSKDVVEKYVKNGAWVLEKEVDMSIVVPAATVTVKAYTPEPTLLDAIEEFVNKTNSHVNIQSNDSFYIHCGFLGTDFEADNKEELKQLMDAVTVLWNIVNGKK